MIAPMRDRIGNVVLFVGERNLKWIGATVGLLALGSMGPLNLYLAITDPQHLDAFSGWRILLLIVGIWLLTGFLIQGLAVLWLGGIKADPNWAKPAERTW